MSPHRKAIDQLNGKGRREEVETIDGRTFFSDDNWQTVYLVKSGGKPHRITGEAADLARFLAIHAH